MSANPNNESPALPTIRALVESQISRAKDNSDAGDEASYEYHEKLTAELSKLDAMRKDAERLDWFHRNGASATAIDPESDAPGWHIEYRNHPDDEHTQETFDFTLSDAIADAMKKHNEWRLTNGASSGGTGT